jgi:hypothetical protein
VGEKYYYGSFDNRAGGSWVDLCVSGYVHIAGSCEHENVSIGSIKGGEFLD